MKWQQPHTEADVGVEVMQQALGWVLGERARFE